MSDAEHEQPIREHYLFLVDNIDSKFTDLLGRLYASNVLESREKNDLEAVKSIPRRNEKLLSLLRRKTRAKYNHFLTALRDTGHEHVYQELSKSPAVPIGLCKLNAIHKYVMDALNRHVWLTGDV